MNTRTTPRGVFCGLPETSIPKPYKTLLGSLIDYLATVRETYRSLGREPSRFNLEAAKALYEAATQAVSGAPDVADKYVTLSTVTGGGKTLAALAMLVHLHKRGLTGALVSHEIASVEKNAQDLSRLIPERALASWSSIHSTTARADVVRDYAEQGIRATKTYTKREFLAAPIVTATHAEWMADATRKASEGVYDCGSRPRTLVLVDEEVALGNVHEFSPAQVAALADLLSSHVLPKEIRWDSTHEVVASLRAIEARLAGIVDHKTVPEVCKVEYVVSSEELAALDKLTDQEITERVLAGKKWPNIDAAIQQSKAYAEIVRGLKSAAHGRVFYSKDSGGGFVAFTPPAPPRSRTVCLDGTADLNHLYAMSRYVHMIDSLKASYSNVALYAVKTDDEIKDAFAIGDRNHTRAKAERGLAWLVSFLREHTSPGEKVLAYVKKAFIQQMDGSLADSTGAFNPSDPRWEGREVYLASFGMGHGSNKWRDCTVYVQLGEFHRPKRVIAGKIGAADPSVVTEAWTREITPTRTSEATYTAVRDSLLNVAMKQDSARMAIRDLDDDGKPRRPTRLYFVNCHVYRIKRDQQRMYPGSGELQASGAAQRESAPQKVALTLREANARRMTLPELAHRAGVVGANLNRLFSSTEVKAAMRARGWRIEREPNPKGTGRPRNVLVRT
jgi:hypothetical protein